MPVTLIQTNLNLPSSPSLCDGRKLSDVEKALVLNLLHEEPQCPDQTLVSASPTFSTICVRACRHVGMMLSIR